jgi:hypothetical protein
MVAAMTKAAAYYMGIGDKLTGREAIRSYRAAQNALMVSGDNYAHWVKIIQSKIVGEHQPFDMFFHD